MLSRLPTRCPACKVKFTAEEKGLRLHADCVDAWVEVVRAKQRAKQAKEQRAKVKVERAETRKRRTALETIPELIKAAQKEFNAFIRERDRNRPCICCGEPLSSGNGGAGGEFDCGHYRSVGSASHLRFDEANAHGQRKRCNRYGAGRAVDYRIGLIGRLGLHEVERLEADNTPRKWTREELRAIRAEYAAKRRQLLKEQE